MTHIFKESSVLFGAILSGVLGLAGCASTAPSTLLSLPSTSATSATTVLAINSMMPILAVSRLNVPEYMVSRRVRYKIDSSTVGEWPETYWAERIEVSMSNEFNAALQRRMPDWRICEANCTPHAPVVSLQVGVTQLDYVRNEKRLYGTAKFTIEDVSSARPVLRGEERQYRITATGDSPQAQAQAVSDFLKKLASDAARFVTAPSTAINAQP
jgi:uncharacterized lipoprotein YmbA